MSAKIALLADVCDIAMGQAPPGDTYNIEGEGLPLIAGAGDFGDLSPKATKFTTSPTKVSRPGDIVLCIRATIGDRNWSDGEYCLGRGVAGLFGRPEKLDQKYLWHWLGHETPKLKSKGRGATFLQVNKADIGSMEIPLLPLPEQRRIAAILDKADALRAKRGEAIAKLDQLLQSVFLDMFGDPKEEVRLVPFGSLASSQRNSFTNGPFGSDLLSSELTDSGVPVIYIRDIRDGVYSRVSTVHVTPDKAEKIRACSVVPGDLLISKVGDPPGVAAIYPDSEPAAVITQDVIRFRPDAEQVTTYYLWGLLNSELGKRLVKPIIVEATRARFSLRDLKSLQVPVPSLELQKRFDKAAKRIEREAARLFDASLLTDEMFLAIQQKAFAGAL